MLQNASTNLFGTLVRNVSRQKKITSMNCFGKRYFAGQNKSNRDFDDWESKKCLYMPQSDYPSIELRGPIPETKTAFPKVANDPRNDLDGMDHKVYGEALKYVGLKDEEGVVGESYQGCIRQPHPVWTEKECQEVQVTHKQPTDLSGRLAWAVVWTLRRAFDILTGYTFGFKNGSCMLRRITILETVAGIPGMVGAAIRHFRSLRTGERDYGWIHSLLEEAENERMHLLIAMNLHDPHWFVKGIIKLGQILILPFYTIAYIISPKFCHSFVGYIEEEAVKTYTQILDLIDQGKLPCFEVKAHQAARKYYHLPEGVNMRDIITNIRADEAHHRELNHCLSTLGKRDVNPFAPGF